MSTIAIKELLYKMADDMLILGHRNSEWTGMGPILEEDIAFSSMAQDKIGQCHALYQHLHELGEGEPDAVAFMRNAPQFHNCQLVELPAGEYNFSLMRHFLYDLADMIRFELLSESSYEPLSEIAVKFKGEIRYHIMHASTYIQQLGNANDESISRLQASLDEALPYALGIFEKSPHEEAIIKEGIFAGEAALALLWQEKVVEIIGTTALTLPDWNTIDPVYGGRLGKHTEHLQPLLDEMSEVFKLDPSADW